MELLKCADFCVGKCEAQEVIGKENNENIDYNIVRIGFRDTEGIAELIGGGYSFHDRILKMEIQIPDTKNLRMERMDNKIPIDIYSSNRYTDSEREIAYQAYATDRRFHLEPAFWQEKSRCVIDAYMDSFEAKGYDIIKASYCGKVTGFTTVRKIGDAAYENVLGATGGMAGKMCAYALYAGMMDRISEKGGRVYMGYVSSTNTASINLHILLGAKVTATVDEYILRREKRKESGKKVWGGLRDEVFEKDTDWGTA